MRIVVDATAAVRQRAGVGRFARGVLAGLAEVDAHNYYYLITTGLHRVVVEPTALPVSHQWLRLPIPERVARVAWQRLKVAPPPSLLVRRPGIFFTPDFTLPRNGRVPSIMTVHDLSFLTNPECADEGLRRYLSKEVPRSIRAAALIVAVSDTTADALTVLLGVERSRIVIVPNGVDPRFGDTTKREVTAPFGLPERYLLSVGTLEPRKNYTRLLQAMSLVLKSARKSYGVRGHTGTHNHVPSLTLVIAGREGWLYEPIFREVARLGIGSSVRFFTNADDEDLSALYRHAHAFIFPSLYEGFGIPPLEAMAFGVPVASSTGGALPEVLGDAALTFDPLDVDAIALAIQQIMDDNALRADLRLRGMARVKWFTWKRAGAAALAAFDRASA